MTTTIISASATSMGTAGTVNTQLNGGANLTLPESTREIIEAVPYILPLAALTAAEAIETQFRTTSNDVDLVPKSYSHLGPQGGTGAFPFAMHPILEAWHFHTKVNGSEDLDVRGQPLVANTGDVAAGVGFVISSGQTGNRETFWFGPEATTALGTAAATVTGSTYRFNKCERLIEVYGHVAMGTSNVSDSAGGRMLLNSNDYMTAMPVDFPVIPIILALSTYESIATPTSGTKFKVNIPTRDQVAITESFVSEQAVAGNGTFISTIAYNRLGL